MADEDPAVEYFDARRLMVEQELFEDTRDILGLVRYMRELVDEAETFEAYRKAVKFMPYCNHAIVEYSKDIDRNKNRFKRGDL